MLHAFTRNYNDLSTESGFQFEFFCDCCGNGYKSTFWRKEKTVNCPSTIIFVFKKHFYVFNKNIPYSKTKNKKKVR